MSNKQIDLSFNLPPVSESGHLAMGILAHVTEGRGTQLIK